MKIKELEEILDVMRKDNTSGASEFIDKALEIVKAQLKLIKDPHRDIRNDIIYLLNRIIGTRPSMAPLINTMGYLVNNLENFSKIIIEDRLNQFEEDEEKRKRLLASNFHNFWKDGKLKTQKIILISYSSTIINLLLENKELNFEIYVLESRPLLEGQRVAEILSKHFKTHLIIDAAIGYFINDIDVVLIGADSILKDGSIINKVGTFPLCLLAYTQKIEVIVVCDSFKYNLKSHYGYMIEILKKPIKEVYNKIITNKFLEVHNFYFDITPPKYISGIISDLGVLSISKFLRKVKKTLPLEWFKYLITKKEI
ncbi:MAG: translation initiation factor eIF-2B [Promethearchaeota archaeon]